MLSALFSQHFGGQSTSSNAETFFLETTSNKGLAPLLRFHLSCLHSLCNVRTLCSLSCRCTTKALPHSAAQSSSPHQDSLRAGDLCRQLWDPQVGWFRERNRGFRDSPRNLGSSSAAALCDELSYSDSGVFLFLFVFFCKMEIMLHSSRDHGEGGVRQRVRLLQHSAWQS